MGSLLLLLAEPAIAARGAEGLRRTAGECGLALWSGWVLAGVLVRADGAWHMRLGAWVSRAGFLSSYSVAAISSPTSPLMTGLMVAVLLAVRLSSSPPWGRLAAVAGALYLLVLLTLRVVSSLQILTRSGFASSSGRAVGYLLAVGLAIANWLLGGLPPLQWFRQVVEGSAAAAGLGTAGLLGLALAMCIVDGWLARRELLGGRFEPTRRPFCASWLGGGRGAGPALRRASLLGLARQRGLAAAVLLFALWFPMALVFDRSLAAPGILILSGGFAMLFPYWLRGNMLGMDVGGVWRYACLRVRPSFLLGERGKAISLLQLGAVWPTLTLCALWRPGGVVGITAVLAFIVASLALQDLLGQILSLRFPRPTRRCDDDKDATAGAITVLIVSLAFPALFAGAYVATAGSWSAWCWPAILATACVVVRRLSLRRLAKADADIWTDGILRELGAT